MVPQNRHRYLVATRLLLAGLAVAGLPACKGKPNGNNDGGSNQRVTPPPDLPEYGIAPPLETKQPEVVRFLRSFMQTCLTGDYDAYRNLVSRYENPEPRERFAAIFKSLKQMNVLTIEALPPIEHSTATYVVTCAVAFRPESAIAKRQHDRALAFLVVQEQGAMRVRRAPARLQPHTGSQPTSDIADDAPPTFPWEVNVN